MDGEPQTGRDPATGQTPQYRAFISYSHADTRFAGGLHRRLETWRLPDGTKLAPIFLDRAELAAGPDLPAQVREALARSAALVVVASPAARASRWVAQEIALFRELHPERPILAALIEGEPGEAFPDPLTAHSGQTFEPLAADFRKGHDGYRLGLLKIVAGLSGLPLDRLIQRDAQQRQRRVMAVTAGALVLSIVLGALLVVAVRARAEAERQRAEAEGMVEFMLTDLRDRLKGVGSLKAMAAVNQRALGYYSAQDLSRLPDASLSRRARVLHAMGEDDTRLGDFPAAQAKYREAHRATAAVLARRPGDPDAIFAHAQSEYWVGEAAWRQAQLATAETHWRGYQTQAQALAKAEPETRRSLMELGYADGNLCELTMRKTEDPKRALTYCQSASAHLRQALAIDPNHAETALALANRLGWQAGVEIEVGRFSQAIALRNEEAALVERLLRAEPDNAEYRERRLWPDIGIGHALWKQGRQVEAITLLERCLAQYDKLAATRSEDVTIAETQIRISMILALAAREIRSRKAAEFATRTRQLHQQLKRTHTAAQMARFDQMLAKLEPTEEP
jgi:tetratricopeptide (TPR) repeat protein